MKGTGRSAAGLRMMAADQAAASASAVRNMA